VGLLAAGMLFALYTRSDDPLIAAVPVVSMVAVMLDSQLRALEIVLGAVSLCLVMAAIVPIQGGLEGLCLSVGASALLGLGGTRGRPWLLRATGGVASQIAGRLQPPGPDAARSQAPLPNVEPEPVARGKEVARNAEGGLTLPGLQELSRRQREVISLVLQGLTAREIGARLFISERTVETHVSNILAKFGAASRAEIAVRLIEERQIAARP